MLSAGAARQWSEADDMGMAQLALADVERLLLGGDEAGEGVEGTSGMGEGQRELESDNGDRVRGSESSRSAEETEKKKESRQVSVPCGDALAAPIHGKAFNGASRSAASCSKSTDAGGEAATAGAAVDAGAAGAGATSDTSLATPAKDPTATAATMPPAEAAAAVEPSDWLFLLHDDAHWDLLPPFSLPPLSLPALPPPPSAVPPGAMGVPLLPSPHAHAHLLPPADLTQIGSSGDLHSSLPLPLPSSHSPGDPLSPDGAACASGTWHALTGRMGSGLGSDGSHGSGGGSGGAGGMGCGSGRRSEEVGWASGGVEGSRDKGEALKQQLGRGAAVGAGGKSAEAVGGGVETGDGKGQEEGERRAFAVALVTCTHCSSLLQVDVPTALPPSAICTLFCGHCSALLALPPASLSHRHPSSTPTTPASLDCLHSLPPIRLAQRSRQAMAAGSADGAGQGGQGRWFGSAAAAAGGVALGSTAMPYSRPSSAPPLPSAPLRTSSPALDGGLVAGPCTADGETAEQRTTQQPPPLPLPSAGTRLCADVSDSPAPAAPAADATISVPDGGGSTGGGARARAGHGGRRKRKGASSLTGSGAVGGREVEEGGERSGEEESGRGGGQRTGGKAGGRVMRNDGVAVVKRHRKASTYNLFIRDEMMRLRAANPDMDHREAFKEAARRWGSAAENVRGSHALAAAARARALLFYPSRPLHPPSMPSDLSAPPAAAAGLHAAAAPVAVAGGMAGLQGVAGQGPCEAGGGRMQGKGALQAGLAAAGERWLVQAQDREGQGVEGEGLWAGAWRKEGGLLQPGNGGWEEGSVVVGAGSALVGLGRQGVLEANVCNQWRGGADELMSAAEGHVEERQEGLADGLLAVASEAATTHPLEHYVWTLEGSQQQQPPHLLHSEAYKRLAAGISSKLKTS